VYYQPESSGAKSPLLIELTPLVDRKLSHRQHECFLAAEKPTGIPNWHVPTLEVTPIQEKVFQTFFEKVRSLERIKSFQPEI